MLLIFYFLIIMYEEYLELRSKNYIYKSFIIAKISLWQ